MLLGQSVCSKPAREQGTPCTGHQAGEAGDIARVMYKTSVPLQPLVAYLVVQRVKSVTDCLLAVDQHLSCHEHKMDSICSMSCTQLSLGEHLLCICSARKPCPGSREESFLCLARGDGFLFSWKQ